MTDASININLNDTSVQEFDTEGNPVMPQPNLGADFAEAYAAMVESFERRIENSPEEQERKLAEEIGRELDDLLQALDQRAETPPATQTGGTPPTDGSGGGGIEPPDPPEDNNTSSVEVPARDYLDHFDDPLPSTMPDAGDDGGGNQPPDNPDVDLIPEGAQQGVDQATDAAAAGAFLLGPEVGMAVMVLGDIIDNVILAFQGLEQIVEAVDDAMESIVEDTRPFSADVAFSAAIRDVNNLLIRMDRAEEMGPDIAKWIETRTDIDIILGKMATDVSHELLPLIQSGTELLSDILAAVHTLGPVTSGILQGVISAIGAAMGPGTLAVIADELKKLHKAAEDHRKHLKEEMLKKNSLLTGGFNQWLQQQAMPINQPGLLGAPGQIVGGLAPGN